MLTKAHSLFQTSINMGKFGMATKNNNKLKDAFHFPKHKGLLDDEAYVTEEE